MILFYKQGEKLRSVSRDQLKRSVSRDQLKLSSDSMSISVDTEDYIYLLSYDSSMILKLSKDGSSIVKQCSVDANGHNCVAVVGEEVMVCERNNRGTIMVYNRELNYVRKIVGAGMGELCALATDSAGCIYAADSNKLCVHIFSLQGDHLSSFGCIKRDRFLRNQRKQLDFCVTGEFVYVCNDFDHNVCVFTKEGELVTTFGQRGEKSGEFKTPYALHLDADGFVYICDRYNNRIQVF